MGFAARGASAMATVVSVAFNVPLRPSAGAGGRACRGVSESFGASASFAASKRVGVGVGSSFRVGVSFGGGGGGWDFGADVRSATGAAVLTSGSGWDALAGTEALRDSALCT